MLTSAVHPLSIGADGFYRIDQDTETQDYDEKASTSIAGVMCVQHQDTTRERDRSRFKAGRKSFSRSVSGRWLLTSACGVRVKRHLRDKVTVQWEHESNTLQHTTLLLSA